MTSGHYRRRAPPRPGVSRPRANLRQIDFRDTRERQSGAYFDFGRPLIVVDARGHFQIDTTIPERYVEWVYLPLELPEIERQVSFRHESRGLLKWLVRSAVPK